MPRWFMSTVHMGPEEAVKAHMDLHAKLSIGIHFGTFQLSDESIDAPIIELEKSLIKNHIPTSRFLALQNGETVEVKK